MIPKAPQSKQSWLLCVTSQRGKHVSPSSFHLSPRRCVSVTFAAGSQWLILSSGGCLAHSERRAGRTGGELLLQDSPTRGHLGRSTCGKLLQDTACRIHAKKNKKQNSSACLLFPLALLFHASTGRIVQTVARFWDFPVLC